MPLIFAADYEDNLILTDNRSYMLYMRCINGVKDYKLVAVMPEVSPELFETVKAAITERGFDPKLMQVLPCNNSLK